MATTRAEAAQYLKDAGGLKLVVFGADGHQVAAMFVQGSVKYDMEEATFVALAEDGPTVGELFVDETVGLRREHRRLARPADAHAPRQPLRPPSEASTDSPPRHRLSGPVPRDWSRAHCLVMKSRS
jgi:hypothetical protein